MSGHVAIRRGRLAPFLAANQPAAPPASGRRTLQIAELRAWILREPVSRRAYMVLRLRARSGETGYGEGRPAAPADVSWARQFLTGKDASAYEVLGRGLAQAPAVRAAVDIALLDLMGKRANAPVYQLLGGPTRHKARALAVLPAGAPVPDSLARAKESGFRAFLVPAPPHPGQGARGSLARAARDLLEACRSAAGEECDFVLDGAGGFSPAEAARVSASIENFHPLWFDEPCPVVNLDAVARLAAENVTPIGFGRDIHQSSVFQDLLRHDAIDVLRPDLGLNGITQIRRIAALGETYYIAVAPYQDGGPIGTAAALHLAASLPNFFIQQLPACPAEADRAMRAELLGAAVESVDSGFLRLPAGPGIGTPVNEKALAKYGEAIL